MVMVQQPQQQMVMVQQPQQQVIMVQQPQQQVISSGKPVFDPHTEMVLANANRLRLIQRRAFLEGFTGGAYPNLYSVCDWNQLHQQVRNGKPYGQPIPRPIFVIEEESGDCCSGDWWCRVCCSPN